MIWRLNAFHIGAPKTLTDPINGEGTTKVTRWRDTVKNGRRGAQRSVFYLGHGWGVSDILVTRREVVERVTSERVTGYWGRVKHPYQTGSKGLWKQGDVIESQGKRTREIDSWWIEVKEWGERKNKEDQPWEAVASSNISKSNKPILISCRSVEFCRSVKSTREGGLDSEDWAHRDGYEGERHLHVKLISCDLHDIFNASAFYVSNALLQGISIGIYAALHSNVNVG